MFKLSQGIRETAASAMWYVLVIQQRLSKTSHVSQFVPDLHEAIFKWNGCVKQLEYIKWIVSCNLTLCIVSARCVLYSSLQHKQELGNGKGLGSQIS